MSGKEPPSKEAPPDPPREDEVRQVIEEYIRDQRAIAEKLRRS
jgi:hypothetical protein